MIEEKRDGEKGSPRERIWSAMDHIEDQRRARAWDWSKASNSSVVGR